MATTNMKDSWVSWCGDLLVGLVVLVLIVQASSPAQAGQGGGTNAEISVEPIASLTVGPAQVRTVEAMRQAQAVAGLASEPVALPFRPTMDPSEYQRAKAAASAASAFAVNRAGINAFTEPLAPPTVVLDGEGVNQITACGTCRPPDTHGAVGLTQFVEITNTHVDVFQKVDLATLDLSVTLAAFFGYAARPLFDPRVVYDGTWNRWVMTAEAFKESPTVQAYLIAVSQTPDAMGPYFTYNINIDINANDDFWDYPQLGLDQDSVIFTGSVFDDPGTMFRGARVFALAKARLYNGLGILSVPLFQPPICGTIAPPIVLDQNGNTFLVCAPTSGTTVRKYTMTNSSRPNLTAVVASTITVPAYTFPPDAPQPGTTFLIDTLDGRFQNASTQVGNSLWQVHSINSGGFARPRWYEFNTSMDTINQSGLISTSATSWDFNPAIVADLSNTRTFVNYSSTDVAAGTNAQVRFASCKPATPACAMDATAPAEFTSSTFYAQDSPSNRWGDYSAVTIDPTNPDIAFLVNEYIQNATTWGTRIAEISF